MKNSLRFLGALCLALPCLLSAQSGAKGYEEKVYPTCTFKAKAGEMDAAKNWHDGKAPSEKFARVHIPGGCTVTVSKPFPNEFSAVLLGMITDKKATMYLGKGGEISAGVFLVPFPNTKPYNGELVIDGGQLVTNNTALPALNTGLFIGSSGTVSGTGRLAISSGTLTGRIFVGSSLSGTQVGTLSVIGSQAVISDRGSGENFLDVRAFGVVEFVLDEKGVSPIELRKSVLRVYEGATFRVDGTAYKGEAKNIPLVITDKLARFGAPKFEVTGFAAPMQATISLERKGVVLKLTRK